MWERVAAGALERMGSRGARTLSVVECRFIVHIVMIYTAKHKARGISIEDYFCTK